MATIKGSSSNFVEAVVEASLGIETIASSKHLLEASLATGEAILRGCVETAMGRFTRRALKHVWSWRHRGLWSYWIHCRLVLRERNKNKNLPAPFRGATRLRRIFDESCSWKKVLESCPECLGRSVRVEGCLGGRLTGRQWGPKPRPFPSPEGVP